MHVLFSENKNQKTICTISKEKCNPWVEWRVLWNERGIILLLSITNTLYFCSIGLWECAIRSSHKATAVSSLYVIWSVCCEQCLLPEVWGSVPRGAAGSCGHCGSWQNEFCIELRTVVKGGSGKWRNQCPTPTCPRGWKTQCSIQTAFQ